MSRIAVRGRSVRPSVTRSAPPTAITMLARTDGRPPSKIDARMRERGRTAVETFDTPAALAWPLETDPVCSGELPPTLAVGAATVPVGDRHCEAVATFWHRSDQSVLSRVTKRFTDRKHVIREIRIPLRRCQTKSLATTVLSYAADRGSPPGQAGGRTPLESWGQAPVP